MHHHADVHIVTCVLHLARSSHARAFCISLARSSHAHAASSVCRQVVGHVLIRSCQTNVEKLHAELATTHCHRRMICVPIDVPRKYARYLRSAASRSYGPGEDLDRSGVDFSLRTIGRRADAVDEDMEVEEIEGDEEIGDIGDIGDHGGDSADDPLLMSRKQFRAAFKDDSAEVQSALFQHSTRIAPHAKFLEKHMQIKVPCPHRRAPHASYCCRCVLMGNR